MKMIKVFWAAPAILLCVAAMAQESSSSLLLRTDLGDLENQELMVLTVTYPPGVSSAAHRHNAHTFVYVLEGAVDMQVVGGEVQRLRPGEDFYETPEDIHVVSRNASDTEPAKILVVFVKEKDAPTTVIE